MKVTRDQIQARARELRNQKFTIKATLEMNAGARPISSSPRNAAGAATDNKEGHAADANQGNNQELGKTA